MDDRHDPCSIAAGLCFLCRRWTYGAGGFGHFVHISSLLRLIIFSRIYEEEEKYPKAAALITTTGHSRSQVPARHIMMVMVLMCCSVIYAIESLFIKVLSNIGFSDVVISALCYAFVLSLYLTLTTKYEVRAGIFVVMGPSW